MNNLFKDFAQARAERNGYLLASTLSPVAMPDKPQQLWSIYHSTTAHNLKNDIKHFIATHVSDRDKAIKQELNGWVDVYMAYWKTLGEILAGESGKSTWTKAYESWRDLTSMLIRGYQNHNFEAWTIPCLYVVGKYLRLFAIQSDKERVQAAASVDLSATGAALMQDDFTEIDEHAQLTDCEQHLKRIFTLCLNDRAPLAKSRKWGLYFVINLLFKTYFKLNSASLSRTILKALDAYKGGIPKLEEVPTSQSVTFKYYEGVLFFLEEDYTSAEKHLTEAQKLCHKDAKQNMERILTYLIPCRLLTSHELPTERLLKPYPRLQKLFQPLARCIKEGDLKGFDLALQEEEQFAVKRRIYLTLERSRDIALRNLLRKVFLAGGFMEAEEGKPPARRTRVPIIEFQAAISMRSGGQSVDVDEVECLIANMIYKGHMKGYIARERGMVVLSKSGAFPGTGV